MEKKSTRWELSKISAISPELLSMIIWGVFEKFYRMNPERPRIDEIQEGKKFDKAALTLYVMKDVIEYCRENYSNRNEKNAHIEDQVISMVASVVDNIPGELGALGIKVEGSQKMSTPKLIEKRSFEGFKNLLPLVYQGIHKPIKIELTRVQLEALCLYSYDKSFDGLKCSNYKFYLWDGHIRLIRTKLRGVFMPMLKSVFDALEIADAKGGANKSMKRACEMFTRETKRICEGLTDGKYVIQKEDYLDELIGLMNDCERGFGVCIPKFNNKWEVGKGEDILAINKKQNTGFLDQNDVPTKRPFKYIRIFLVDGNSLNPNKLSDSEASMIKNQLSHDIDVFVVFKEAWKHLSDTELNRLDFTILRIDGCPMLMETLFTGDEVEGGIFYTDENKAETYYNETLGRILTNDNAGSIYQATSNGKAVKLTQLNDIGVKGLSGVALKEIYEPSKKR